MEFGPRALGARSILADPRNPENQDRVNLKIKFRESFRPFAPAVLAERAERVLRARAREPVHAARRAGARTAARSLPAITHVDGSARVQTVDRRDEPALPRPASQAFDRLDRRAGADQHLVQRARRADRLLARGRARCFLSTGMDVLVIDRFVLRKEQPAVDLIQVAELPTAFALD